MKKRNKKNNLNQKSFYFEDYLETNQRNKLLSKSSISEDRIYLLFFFFFCLIFIFSLKILFVSFQEPKFSLKKNNSSSFVPLRRDIIDRNNELISRNVQAYHAAVKPSLIKNKKNFLINMKLIFPDISIKKFEERIKKNKYFYLKKGLTDLERRKLWALGEKGIILEPYQSRIYPQSNLYSHILGQIDYDNYGISGVEKSFDHELRDQQKINTPLKLSLDTNLQFLIKNELKDSIKDFQAEGAAGLLMNVNNGEILSLVSLPDYNINLRNNIFHKNYMNKITKGVFELGSVFKTFTVALALEEKIYSPDTIIKGISNKIKCSKHTISDIKVFPEELSVEDILIRSSNIGTLKIARKIGEVKYKDFLNRLNLLNTSKIKLDEVGSPLGFRWNKCKLETVSYGHGITTTPLQAAAAYATLSNGGYSIEPKIKKQKNKLKGKKVISEETSNQMNKILRKVVTDKKGTASLANVFGYNIAGKTGTAKKYGASNANLNTFISIFPAERPKYVLLIMLDEPKAAPHITYEFRGQKLKNILRNEAGWNSVYIAGKIIKKIGPILAINNKEFYSQHVVKKSN